MPRLHRLVAILMAFVLVQLVLVESGYACHMSASGVASSASMGNMAMPTGATESASSPAPGDQSPCQFPWAPQGCPSMAPCAPAALAVMRGDVAPSPRLAMAPWRFVPLTPSAVSSAPEIPPPRA